MPTLAPERKIESISLVDLMVITIIAPFPSRLDAQALAALATTRGQDSTAALGGHTCAETMRLRTLPGVRLICTLHLSSWSAPRNGAKPVDYMLVTG